MITGEAIKKAVALAVEMHAAVGASFVRLDDGTYTNKCKNVLEDGFEFKVEGRQLSPRKVRGWLFERRKHPVMDRLPVVWTAFDEDSGCSFVGLAEVTE